MGKLVVASAIEGLAHVVVRGETRALVPPGRRGGAASGAEAPDRGRELGRRMSQAASEGFRGELSAEVVPRIEEIYSVLC